MEMVTTQGAVVEVNHHQAEAVAAGGEGGAHQEAAAEVLGEEDLRIHNIAT